MANKTKKAIVNSYLDLINDDNYEKVSVTDLVEKCNISRQTFYYHFDRMEEMIAWAFFQKTKEACDAITDKRSLLEANEPNIQAMNRYANIIKKATKADEIMFLYTTIQKCASAFLSDYLRKKARFSHVENFDCLMDTWAYAVSARIIEEARKDNPDFAAITEKNYKKIIDAFMSIK
ncbi:MAG: TetR family transcriptional regulator [Eubacterium sp.]